MEQWMVINKGADFKGIGNKFHIDPVTARIIRNREVIGDEEIHSFLAGTLQELPDVHLMQDLDLLVELLDQKINEKAKIRIIGDYDIDGVMSSYILYRALTRCGAQVDVAIPNRITDGYGLNRNLITEALECGVDTILTCDNGIAAIEEIAYAKEAGMTVLVTDHHEIPFKDVDGERIYMRSEADAIVNPHQKTCTFPYKDLCGAGVAWAVIVALYEKNNIEQREVEDLLEFVAFATVGDIMSLTGLNRILVKEGLKRIHHTTNIGMRALVSQCGLLPEQIDTYHFGFVLGPCINAAGRLDTARRALRLFISESPEEAAAIADELVVLNEERKEMTRQGVEEAKQLVEEGGYEKDPVLILYLPDVHESIAGIIAGRIREYYYRPTFILTKAEDGVKGSGRSTEEYSMYEQMCKCSNLLTKFGGHPMAAGLSLPEENVEIFRKQMNENCPFRAEEIVQTIHIDVPMPVDYVTNALVEEFSILAPFGKDNPKPVFADRNLKISRMWVIGKNQNVLRMTLVSEQGRPLSAIYFGDIEAMRTYLVEQYGIQEVEKAFHGRENNMQISIVYSPKINTYKDSETLQFEIQYYR
ncbi:MAG: single-stranded-DNA-specific exonuclease RecJ [Agathobacter sp.]|nr:single-stranded-DNA-specific exonuclease RecJ [Lachnospiraceae bacterium]MDY2619634.1 single-stranded-DNA-specific exonuclease RecJ [Agathobacter sp.]